MPACAVQKCDKCFFLNVFCIHKIAGLILAILGTSAVVDKKYPSFTILLFCLHHVIKHITGQFEPVLLLDRTCAPSCSPQLNT